MYIMYVDESGDPGDKITTKGRENSRHYILSGLILPVAEWKTSFERLKNLRLGIKNQFGLPIRVEIHAVELVRINKIKAYRSIKKVGRLKLLETYISALSNVFSTGKIINICYDKDQTDHDGFEDYSEKAWNRLLQRYDTFLKQEKTQGIVISDTTNEPQIRRLLRKMRAFNPVPSKFGGAYQALVDSIIEDPLFHHSMHSYFIQSADVIAHTLYRKEFPKTSLRKHSVHRFFDYLEPLLLKQACKEDPLGIVRK